MTIEGELKDAINRLPISAASQQRLEELTGKFPFHLRGISSEAFIANSPLWRDLWLEDPADFPHNFIHARRAVHNGIISGAILRLSEREIATISSALWVHDLGKAMVSKGIIKEDEHNLGSWVFAMELLFDMKDVDVEAAARAALLHTCDVLPKEATIIDRVVRDTDRIELLPWSAVVRYSFYPPFNFRHSVFSSREDYLDLMSGDSILADKKVPWKRGYEKEAKRFVLNEVFPFLSKQGLLGPMIDKIDEALKHIDGVTNNDGSWLIEPVMPEIKTAFYERIEAAAIFTTLLLLQKYKNKHGGEFALATAKIMAAELTQSGLTKEAKKIDGILKLLM